MSEAEIIKLGFEGARFVFDVIARFIAGDTSEPVRRVIDVLPSELRSELELERQRSAMRRDLEQALPEDGS
jgi:hypothetical protein